MNTPIFPEGIMFKNPHEKAPEWIKGQVFINPIKLNKWLQDNPTALTERGWLNLDLKKSKNETMYFQVNTWKPADIKPDFPKDELTMPNFGENDEYLNNTQAAIGRATIPRSNFDVNGVENIGFNKDDIPF